jgi:hypothetical protein
MGYYLVSNRFTLKAFVGRNYSEPSISDAVTTMHVEMLLSYLRPASAAASSQDSVVRSIAEKGGSAATA